MAFNAAAFADKLRRVDASQPAVTSLSKYIQYQAQVSFSGMSIECLFVHFTVSMLIIY